MAYKIYLVEDDQNLNDILSSYLKKEGWEVECFTAGRPAQAKITAEPDLWILDIMLPDIDGFQLISEIKAENEEIPVIFISARDADLDRIIGLEKGSDDYLAKPFSPRELVIRVKNLFKRIYGKKPDDSVHSYAGYIIDYNGRRVISQNTEKDIELTAKEFDLLTFLFDNLQNALSREQIIENVWGDDYYGSDRVVDDLIRRLRQKMPGIKIETVYGHGYRMVKQ
ncbi:two-component system response regulator CssR [Halanaerobium saccharolyticum]|uniref:Stage 0 sporulation protein A homolog n=1 Tax=Halanaerobium saccharolyticum TaxID=43595 RepID=A0A4R7YLU5_9FIRM|nr:response regulator transcription factor [Halanaerobium saccharolyticum]RAK04114.1 two-component system response regulator CssR [Halanaerobium saccharolyticum]TDV97888.1 two-component system response regulator CssR [Halanaerobium saccharolyticum]TDX50991.1 two-component system response regulator CssR [Halanaerobium saccharolyticum]